LAARLLAVDDARHVQPGLADDEAAQLDDHLRGWLARSDPLDQGREALTDLLERQRLVLWEIGNAEAAADIEIAERLLRLVGQAQRQLHGLPLGLADGRGAQVLRAGEDMKALEAKPQRGGRPEIGARGPHRSPRAPAARPLGNRECRSRRRY